MKQILLILLLLTCSCVSVQKAKKVLDKNGLAAAEYCADKFPVTEEVIPGETITITDTVEVPGPVLECPETTHPGTGQVYRPQVQCPPGKTVTQTITRTDTIIRENTAKVKALEGRLQESETNLKITTAERDKAATRAHNRGLGLIFILVSAAAFVGYKTVRFFSV